MAGADGSGVAGNEHSEASPAGKSLEVRQGLGRSSAWRAFRFGCLGLLLVMCSGLGALGYALQSGPVALQIFGGNKLMIGSNDFVLANSSFQDGTTYFVDLNGNGVRNILQLDYLSQTHSLQLVLHYASRAEEGEHSLATMRLP